MSRAKVLSDFRDLKHDLKLRKKGEIFEEAEHRIEKLVNLGFVEFAKEESEKTDKKKG